MFVGEYFDKNYFTPKRLQFDENVKYLIVIGYMLIGL